MYYIFIYFTYLTDVWGFFKCVIEKRACAANKDCTAAGSDVDGDGTADGQYCDLTAL